MSLSDLNKVANKNLGEWEGIEPMARPQIHKYIYSGQMFIELGNLTSDPREKILKQMWKLEPTLGLLQRGHW